MYTPIARRIGIVAAAATATLYAAYATVLTLGLMSLPSPDQQIGEPFFSLLELLILFLAPALVMLMVAVHGWAPAPAKALSLAALVFTTLLACITACVHFVVLTLSRHPNFVDWPGAPLLFSFQWPSLAYALDILAWDVFFPLAMLCAAPVFSGSRLALAIRWLMVVSALLALAGLAGVVTGDMQIRNIGVVGYVGVFLPVSLLLAVLFYRSPAQNDPGQET